MSDKEYKVLIVDDEEDILEFLTFNLEKENYEVRTAKNGQEALKTLYGFSPDLILLDIQLSDGLSFEIFEIKFLLLGPKIPKQTRSSVISLNSKLGDKCFKMCALS